LAERLFPQKLHEDPLLLDDLRREIGRGLTLQEDRAEHERLLLRLAAGAANEHLYVSFPRIETAEARARVPSFYALEVMRAVTGRIPDHQTLESQASEEANASLGWPAPQRPEDAIDDFEHDLSVLRLLMRSEKDVKGHAHYILRLNDCVRRSASERWARARQPWSSYDGLVRVTDATKPFLQSQRLTARPYSVSALQNYAYCPYRFLLSAMYRLKPLEEPEPLDRMDPLTKGSLFHEVLAEFFRALQQRQMAMATTPIDAVLELLDVTLARVAANYAELLAPAVDRVWQDEIAGIRTDLHIWARNLAQSTGWEPWLFEFGFGLPDTPGRDPNSRREPVTIDGRFILRGAIDLVERKSGTSLLRVTDHKTSKNRSERGSIIGQGRQLQPVIYSLAVEAATGCSVESARFSYCTTAGGFTEHNVPINERTRRMGIEALEIIDRAVELGMLPPAPAEKACAYCDFLSVCGPNQERRSRRKSPKEIADLIELRGRQ
jgi:CRISPR/Cas system-associated exonuclease Cas4 (RecB family)